MRNVPKAARKICEANAPLLDVPLERLVMAAEPNVFKAVSQLKP